MRIIIPGQPVPLQRPRFYGGRVIDSQAAIKSKLAMVAKDIVLEARRNDPEAPTLECAYHLDMEFYLEMPVSWSSRKKASRPLHTSRPDLDNLVKMWGDILNGILYLDDKQVVSIKATKLYSETPQTVIHATSL